MYISTFFRSSFAELGAKVVLWDINKEANEAVADEIKKKGQTAYPFCCDCSKREDIYQTAAHVRTEVEGLHVYRLVLFWLTLYQPMMHICVMSSHMPIRIYMGV